MSWDEYRKRMSIKFTLEKFGMPDFWIRVRKLGSMTPAEQKTIAKVASRVEERDLSKPATPEDLEKDISNLRETFKLLILDWNLEDPDMGGALSPKDDNAYEKLPIEILTFIMGEIGKSGEEITVPEKTGTLSGQP